MAQLNSSGIGTRSVVLVNSLGISRATLGATLTALINAGLVIRNPGYGHPLRPEYVLTPTGKRVAPCCASFENLVDDLGVGTLAHHKWTAPLLFTISEGHTRFNLIEATPLGISPRALTITLRSLSEADLISRRVDPGYPPTTSYQLSDSGARVANCVALLTTEFSKR